MKRSVRSLAVALALLLSLCHYFVFLGSILLYMEELGKSFSL